MGSVDDLVRRARRRWISHVLLNQAVLAACAAMAALIVVLLAGTDLLSWRWILAVVAAGMFAGGWRLRRQIPSGYAVAQVIDHRVNFPDSLSTAYFYRHVAGAKGSPALKAAQLSEANVLAGTVSVQKAIPYSSPRSLYALAALGLAASGLLAVRYGISHRLDLRPPLAMMVLDVFHFTAKADPIAQKQKTDRRTRELLNEFGLSLDAEQDRRGQGEQEQAPASAPAEDAEVSEKGESGRAGQDGQAEQAGEQREGDEEAAGVSIPNAGEEGRQTGEQESGASTQASSGKQGPSNSPESNSLLNKFRDALSNLMSRLKPRPQGDQGQQFASAGEGKSDSGKGSESDQPGSERASNGDSKGLPGSQGQSQQEGEGTQQASEGGQGGQGGRDSEQASREGRSGMGKEDGNKDVREAEQLAAMGKISEILGKRSQNLTGEVMVEVTSSKQQLKTAYSQQDAEHADAGGEIHRDEVPAAYQRFVRQYFEEIRKAPPIKPAEPAANAARP